MAKDTTANTEANDTERHPLRWSDVDSQGVACVTLPREERVPCETPQVTWTQRNSEVVVLIKPDGEVVLPKGKESLSEASRVFWNTVQMYGQNQTARMKQLYRLLADAQAFVTEPTLSAAIADSLESKPDFLKGT